MNNKGLVILVVIMTVFTFYFFSLEKTGQAIKEEGDNLPSWAGSPYKDGNLIFDIIVNLIVDPKSKASIKVTNDIIFNKGYYFDGNEWKSYSLTGETYSGNWLKNSASAKLDISNLPEGINYAVAYSCSRKNGEWECPKNKLNKAAWQLQSFEKKLSIKTDSRISNPNDKGEGDNIPPIIVMNVKCEGSNGPGIPGSKENPCKFQSGVFVDFFSSYDPDSPGSVDNIGSLQGGMIYRYRPGDLCGTGPPLYGCRGSCQTGTFSPFYVKKLSRITIVGSLSDGIDTTTTQKGIYINPGPDPCRNGKEVGQCTSGQIKCFGNSYYTCTPNPYNGVNSFTQTWCDINAPHYSNTQCGQKTTYCIGFDDGGKGFAPKGLVWKTTDSLDYPFKDSCGSYSFGTKKIYPTSYGLEPEYCASAGDGSKFVKESLLISG